MTEQNEQPPITPPDGEVWLLAVHEALTDDLISWLHTRGLEVHRLPVATGGEPVWSTTPAWYNFVAPEVREAAVRVARWGLHLDEDKARTIRAWRAKDDLTWRGVAAAAVEKWQLNWGTNQVFGRDLCTAAAHLLGEDPGDEPWN